jgi:hypothetical protein
MEHQWNEIDRGKPKYSEKNLSQCHFIHHNPTWTDPGSNLGLRDERPATYRLSHGTAFLTELNVIGPVHATKSIGEQSCSCTRS